MLERARGAQPIDSVLCFEAELVHLAHYMLSAARELLGQLQKRAGGRGVNGQEA